MTDKRAIIQLGKKTGAGKVGPIKHQFGSLFFTPFITL